MPSALIQKWRIVVLLALAAATPPRAEPDRFDRLLGLAQVWAEVKFFHPAMFQRAIDWDGALTRALPEVEAAGDAASYRAAIGHLLAAVGDPRTTVDTGTDEPAPTEWKTWPEPAVLVLDARLPTSRSDVGATRQRAREARDELAKARVAVIDLHGLPDDDNRLLSSILDALPATQVWPTLRSIQHIGFRSQGETNRNRYRTSWTVTTGGAATPGGQPGPSHVVFAVDPRHALPLEAIALWLNGHATLVAPAALDDSAAAITKRVELPWDVHATVRVTDIRLPGGRGVQADVVTRPGEDLRTRAIAVAEAIAHGSAPPHAAERRASTTDELVVADDDDRPAGLPSRERRMLAVIKAWAVIAYFHGTPRLDVDWDQQLRPMLTRIDAVTDLDSYRTALDELMPLLRDGHAYARPRSEIGKRASSVIYWRRIEGKIVAGGLRDEEVARAAGIALGDELIRVDGVAAEDVAARVLRSVAGGIEEGRAQWAVATIDRGLIGTTVEIETRGRDGRSHKVTLRRDYDYDHNFWARQGPHFRMVDHDIGYADLARLTSNEVDAMFDTVGKARALVLDMRGYPNGTGAVLGKRFNALGATANAEFRTPLVDARTARADISARALQRLGASDKPIYRGKVVILIDDRAISAAEHMCLTLEAASGATFIGSPTDGTNGEETYVRLPGEIEMRFTGQEIFHADGRPLQQVGVQPQITIRPTLRGLRAGKDEVLDRALRFLRTGR